jgi:hypothetical protein
LLDWAWCSGEEPSRQELQLLSEYRLTEYDPIFIGLSVSWRPSTAHCASSFCSFEKPMSRDRWYLIGTSQLSVRSVSICQFLGRKYLISFTYLHYRLVTLYRGLISKSSPI